MIAELAGLDLDETGRAAEAVRLADDAQLRLRAGAAEDGRTTKLRADEDAPSPSAATALHVRTTWTPFAASC